MEDSTGQHAGMDMGMAMQGMFGPYPMSREASGTSWQPEATPMSGRHFGEGPWQKMFHGFANAVYSDNDGPRGGDDVFAESMFMLMGRRQFGDGVIGLRAMVSLDPWLVGKDGYRVLFQTGETADGRTPLVDRQHPHDLFMELAASYSMALGDDSSLFLYAGLPGEPALGPPAFMHRFSGADNPEAPLGHHWLDATHISFGVITAGWTWRNVKVEASAFNGRELDERRYDIELRSLDSWSARVSFNPTPRWAWQVSYGELKSPEQLEPDVDMRRTTASAMYHRPVASGQWQTTLAWGRNEKRPGPATEAWLLESAYQWSSQWTVFGRIEQVEKDELFREGEPLHDQIFTVDKATFGAVRDFPGGNFGRVGVGFQVSRHFIPAVLETAYGNDPDSWLVFLRWKL